jgi:hypothetical protein
MMFGRKMSASASGDKRKTLRSETFASAISDTPALLSSFELD